MSNPLFDNILIREGEDFGAVWIITDAEGEPIDFSVGGYSFVFTMWQDSGSSEPDAVTLTSNPASGIALGTDGSLTVGWDPSTTATLIATGWDQKPRGRFAAVMTDPGGKKTTEVEGTSLVQRGRPRS